MPPPPKRRARVAANTQGDTAFAVLSSSLLFRLITPFASGWPGALLERWNAPTVKKPQSKYRSTNSFLLDLIAHEDLGMLQMTEQAVWIDKSGKTQTFQVEDVCCAIKTGNAAIVRWAFDHASRGKFQLESSCWREALEVFQGDCQLLDVLKSCMALSHENISHAISCSKRQLDTRKCRILAEWLAQHFGAAFVPGVLFATVAAQGDLEAFKSLDRQVYERLPDGVPYRNCKAYPFYSPIVQAAGEGHLEIIQYIHGTGRDQNCSSAAMDSAAYYGHFNVVEFLHTYRTEGCTAGAMDSAAGQGHLNVVQFLHNNQTEGCTMTAMDSAATNGHLEVVQFLHNHRTEGCSKWAINHAADHGHLDVVQFLHNNRTEGCTQWAMDGAASRGHLDTVQFLHTNRTEGCSESAMDYAATFGHFQIVRFLHANRTEGCTANTMDYVAIRGDLELVKLLHEERDEGCTSAAMKYPKEAQAKPAREGGRDPRAVLLFLLENRKEMHNRSLEVLAVQHGDFEVLNAIQRTRGFQYLDGYNVDAVAGKGYLEVLQLVLEHGSAVCSKRAMALAAISGHLDVVQYLHATRQEGCFKTTMLKTAFQDHWDIVAFLYDQYHREHAGAILPVVYCAIRLGRLQFLEQFHQKETNPEIRDKAIRYATHMGHSDVVALLSGKVYVNTTSCVYENSSL